MRMNPLLRERTADSPIDTHQEAVGIDRVVERQRIGADDTFERRFDWLSRARSRSAARGTWRCRTRSCRDQRCRETCSSGAPRPSSCTGPVAARRATLNCSQLHRCSARTGAHERRTPRCCRLRATFLLERARAVVSRGATAAGGAIAAGLLSCPASAAAPSRSAQSNLRATASTRRRKQLGREKDDRRNEDERENSASVHERLVI